LVILSRMVVSTFHRAMLIGYSIGRMRVIGFMFGTRPAQLPLIRPFMVPVEPDGSVYLMFNNRLDAIAAPGMIPLA
jgi:hypothetical protein